MSKLETARQLAKQTAKQEVFTENSPTEHRLESEETKSEVMNFIKAVQQVLDMTVANQQQLNRMEQKITQVEKEHWKQVRMLIIWLMIPLILTITVLMVLVLK